MTGRVGLEPKAVYVPGSGVAPRASTFGSASLMSSRRMSKWICCRNVPAGPARWPVVRAYWKLRRPSGHAIASSLLDLGRCLLDPV
jgi:hypothetical protein